MNSQILSKTDRTSWTRIAMVWRFYLPYTRKKLIGFTLIAILCELLMVYASKHFPEQQSSSIILMCSVMVSAMMAFSGLVFAKPSGRELQILLPACGLEKCIVIIGYVMVVIPLLMYMPSIFMSFRVQTEMLELMGIEYNLSLMIYALLMIEALALTCLWGVLASKRKNAMRNGILGVAAYYFFMTVFSGFIAGVIAGLRGYSETLIEENISTIYTTLSIICGIYIIFALIKCCRIIKHGI